MHLSSAVLAVTLLLAAPARAEEPGLDPACAKPGQRLERQEFVRIGGIEQWLTIRGRSCKNPVVLFLHGGPGNPISPYARAIYGAWEKDFTLVQWDQRGAGRTFGRNRPTEDTRLTWEVMTSDVAEVARHLQRRLGKEKVTLVGSSWGSALGMHAVHAHPELFHAFVASSLLVHARENQRASYARVLSLARAQKDQESVAKLEALGEPPWTDPRHPGVLRRVVRKYEQQRTAPSPRSWWTPAAEDATPEREAELEGGDDYSYLQYVGRRGDGLAATLDLKALGTRLEVPLYVVQGTEDLLTTPELTQAYLDAVTAPEKRLVRVRRTGHGPNAAMVRAEHQLLQHVRSRLR